MASSVSALSYDKYMLDNAVLLKGEMYNSIVILHSGLASQFLTFNIYYLK